MKSLDSLKNKIKNNSSSIILSQTQSAVEVKRLIKKMTAFWDSYMLDCLAARADKAINELLKYSFDEDPEYSVTSIEDLILRLSSDPVNRKVVESIMTVEIPYANVPFSSTSSNGYLSSVEVGYMIASNVLYRNEHAEQSVILKVTSTDSNSKLSLDSIAPSISGNEECFNLFEDFLTELRSFASKYSSNTTGMSDGSQTLELPWTGSPVKKLFDKHLEKTCEKYSYMKVVTVDEIIPEMLTLEVDLASLLLEK